MRQTWSNMGWIEGIATRECADRPSRVPAIGADIEIAPKLEELPAVNESLLPVEDVNEFGSSEYLHRSILAVFYLP
jgi:hypothetical protein